MFKISQYIIMIKEAIETVLREQKEEFDEKKKQLLGL